MKIGIIGAMAVEVERLVAEMEEKTEETVSGVVFYSGRIRGQQVVVAQCGIGKVAAALCCEAMILRYAPDAVINSGCAGTLGAAADIMDVVVASGAVQHDMDTTLLGDVPGFISGVGMVEFPCDETLTENLCRAGEDIGARCVRGVVASGDQFISDSVKKGFITDTFHALACEMEGGAIAHVCYQNQTPVCILRTISDSASGSSEMEYPEFVKKASVQSCEILLRYLENA